MNEVITFIHGEEAFKEAYAQANALFAKGADVLKDMPTTKVDESLLVDGKIDILTLMVALELASSKSEARRLMTQGGVSLNREKISDLTKVVNLSDFDNDSLVLQKGKKTFMKVDII